MADKLKLTYFDGKGRGELTRLVFVYAGKPFEDERIAVEKWSEEKSKHLFGWLPVLTVGENKYCDSMGIAKYVARECGLGGKTSLEQLQIDMVLGMVSDVITKLLDIILEADPAAKQKMKDDAYNGSIPKFLTALEKIISNTKGEFFVGKSITVADLAVFDMADTGKFTDDILKDYPKVKANIAKVAENKSIAEHVKGRKETMF